MNPPCKELSGHDMAPDNEIPTTFGAGVSGAETGAGGGLSFCSGGGDGRFETRGLSSLSGSSLGRFAVSVVDVIVDGPLSGPALVARSANLRLRPLSGSPPSDSEVCRVCGRLEAMSRASSASSVASSTGANELGGASVDWDAQTTSVASMFPCVLSTSWDGAMFGCASGPASCWDSKLCCHLMSSTPWLICRTLTSCSGETLSSGECGCDGVRERDWLWASSTSSSSVVSRCTRPFFAGDFTSNACWYGN